MDYDNLIRFNRYKRLEMTTDLPKEEAIKKSFNIRSEIIESSREQLRGGWVIERQRTDKDFPNSLSVANNIRFTIQDPVTVDDIVDASKKFADKYGIPGTKRPAETSQHVNNKMPNR